ncbi:hypothetical protein I302_108060 [Kwoniella bestiolae CBS 10118]|uniref:Uncharacterized protein n=1 Tax=Kwoniella bestiolae CBS 10118 TaxID=1296100 RepID=A0AAJ8KEY3_9TREE
MRRSRGAKYLDVAVIEDSAKTLQALSNRDEGDDGDTTTLGAPSPMTPIANPPFTDPSKLYDGPRPESGAASLTLKYSAGRDSDTGLMNYMVEAAEEGPKVTCFWHDKPNLLVLQHTLADNAFHIHEEWRKGTPTKNWALRMRSVRNPTQTPSDTDSAEEMYNFTIKPEMKNRFEKTGLGPELQVTVDIKFEKRDEGRDKYTEPRSRFYI